MASSIRRAGANVLRTIARTLDPSALTGKIDLFGKSVPTLNGQPQMFVRSSDFARQISGTECNIWDRPLNPSAYDDEFDSTTLDPAWTPTATPVTAWIQGGINPFANPTDIHYELHTDRRPSWLIVQPPTVTNAQLRKPFSFAGAFFAYARFSYNVRYASTANSDAAAFIQISSNPYDTNNRVYVKLGPDGTNTVVARFYRVQGGAGTLIGSTRNMFAGTSGLQSIETVGIQYIPSSNRFDGWAFGASGSGLWLGTTTLSIVPSTVSLEFGANAATGPGTMLSGVDFIRFVSGSTFLP